MELEFAFKEYGDNPNNFKSIEVDLPTKPTKENNFSRVDTLKIQYCVNCGFPQQSCICTLECII